MWSGRIQLRCLLDQLFEQGNPTRWPVPGLLPTLFDAQQFSDAGDTIAVAVDTDRRREIIGLGTGRSEVETFWTEFVEATGIDQTSEVLALEVVTITLLLALALVVVLAVIFRFAGSSFGGGGLFFT